jgi:hypothetical protein
MITVPEKENGAKRLAGYRLAAARDTAAARWRAKTPSGRLGGWDGGALGLRVRLARSVRALGLDLGFRPYVSILSLQMLHYRLLTEWKQPCRHRKIFPIQRL